MAGVSVGTVDRVLHNRGDVSAASRKKVEDVLERIKYHPNLLVSSIGVKRKITIGIILSEHNPGEYWDQVEKGIRKAFYDYSNIPTERKIFYYDQFSLESCRKAYAEILEYKCDAVIIGPTFRDSILKPLPLNIPATLARTPNLFSTKADMVCFMTNLKWWAVQDSNL